MRVQNRGYYDFVNNNLRECCEFIVPLDNKLKADFFYIKVTKPDDLNDSAKRLISTFKSLGKSRICGSPMYEMPNDSE